MSLLEILGFCLLGLIVLPILAYMIVKFGAAGYYRAKGRESNRNNNKGNQ